MSVPDPSAPRKFRRLGLWLPFVALGLGVLGWSGVWFWARGQVEHRLDASVQTLGTAGYELSWKDRIVGGYPFRMDVTLIEPRVRETSGWALEAPRIEAEAPMHALGSWLIAAPEGFTFVRPTGGPVTVRGRHVRASLTHLGQRPPSFSFEGVKVAFAPQAGAQPFGLTFADRVEFHLRAGPDDEGGVFAKVDGGKARLTGLLARIAGDRPISMTWNSTLSKMSAFSGKTWADAVRRWANAGGKMTVRQAAVTAGDAILDANSGSLGVGGDGRLSGVLEVSLRQAPRALGAMSETGLITPDAAQAASVVTQARQGAGDAAQATIDFQAGRTTLGPVALGAAPKVYDTH